MRNEPTTDELFAGLSSEARTEALRLAARLQAEGEESSHVLQAAREAGIEDRFLRAAAVKVQPLIAKGRVAPTFPVTLAVVPTILFFFAQGYAGSVTFGGVSGANIWLPMFLAALMGASLPRNRNRWLAPLAVVATWVAVTIFFGIVASLEGRGFPEMAYTYAFRIVVVEAALAFFGALLVNAFGSGRELPNHAKSSCPEPR